MVENTGVAFLLAQLGAHASQRFAERLADEELSPPLVGMLRMIATEPGLSQQTLATKLGMVPSRIVAFVDDLERRGWVSRRRGETDRRVNVLVVTEAGEEAMGRIRKVATAHEQSITEGLSAEDVAALRPLLGKLSRLRGLTPGVHPGFRALRP
jgi:DNA-binding MarR family transcriptional regulator